MILDSSFLIDYLDGDATVLEYAEAHAGEETQTLPLAMYEVYLGEVYSEGEPEFVTIDDALRWVDVVTSGHGYGRDAARFLAQLHDAGGSLSPRDGYIGAMAWATGERLVTRDGDFGSDVVRDVIDVDVV
jgi:predicted nucleic acid-binding protein